jgi:hypothetical protein
MPFRPQSTVATDRPLYTRCGKPLDVKLWRWPGNAPNGGAPICPYTDPDGCQRREWAAADARNPDAVAAADEEEEEV